MAHFSKYTFLTEKTAKMSQKTEFPLFKAVFYFIFAIFSLSGPNDGGVEL